MISVVIPAFNAGRFLREAIASVLAQGWPELEVLVVDNASTDDTATIARSFGAPVRYLWSASPGQPPTTNAGVRAARGDWLAFLDADDLWSAGKLVRQVCEFEKHPELEALFGHAVNFTGATPVAGAHGAASMQATVPGTLLVRRDAFHRVGYFDENFTIGSVMDWYLRAREAGLCMDILPDVLLYRRVHEDNLGARHKDRQADYVHILKAALDRQRKRGDGPGE